MWKKYTNSVQKLQIQTKYFNTVELYWKQISSFWSRISFTESTTFTWIKPLTPSGLVLVQDHVVADINSSAGLEMLHDLYHINQTLKTV